MIKFHDGDLGMWVIFDHPLDAPDHYIARLFKLDKPTSAVLLGDSLDEVRFLIDKCYPGLTCIPRSPNDEPQIVETWL